MRPAPCCTTVDSALAPSRFGSLTGLAVLLNAVRMASGVVLPPVRSNAATPATSGVAIDVPLISAVPPSCRGHVDMTEPPTPETVAYAPSLRKCVSRRLASSDAATHSCHEGP